MAACRAEKLIATKRANAGLPGRSLKRPCQVCDRCPPSPSYGAAVFAFAALQAKAGLPSRSPKGEDWCRW